jgi:hypothetical protein
MAPPDAGRTVRATPPSADAASAPAALVDAPPAPPVDALIVPPATDASLPSPPGPRLLRVHDVEAERIAAGVVYAHKLEAKRGIILGSGPPLAREALEAQIGERNLEVDELVVDVLYAHDIKAGSIRIGEAHIEDVKLKVVEDVSAAGPAP